MYLQFLGFPCRIRVTDQRIEPKEKSELIYKDKKRYMEGLINVMHRGKESKLIQLQTDWI